MTEKRIYFKKFDELEAMLGQKPVERPSRVNRIASGIANASSSVLHFARRDGVRRSGTPARTRVVRPVAKKSP